MSIQLMTAVWKVEGLTQAQKLVLLSLADNANDSGVCWPSIPSIAARCCMAERSVTRTIGELEELNHISRESRTGKATIYRITPDRPSPPTESHPDRQSSRPKDTTAPDRPSPTPDSGSGVPCTPNKEITLKEPKLEPPSARADFFSVCFEHIVTKFPNLMTANPSVINQWREAGYDFENNVRPSVDSAAAKGVTPRSFHFFTGPVEDSAKRKVAPAGQRSDAAIRTSTAADIQGKNKILQRFQSGGAA